MDWESSVLPEDCCKKGPCDFNTEVFVSKVGNPCPTLGQLLASRILYALLVGEKQHEIAKARFRAKWSSSLFWVSSLNLYAPYLLSADDLGDFSGISWETLHSGGRRLGACCRKAMNPQKLWTLLSRERFRTQGCSSKVGQLLVHSSPTPHLMGSCRSLPCNSPLATPKRERKGTSWEIGFIQCGCWEEMCSPYTGAKPQPNTGYKSCVHGSRNIIQHWGWVLEEGSWDISRLQHYTGYIQSATSFLPRTQTVSHPRDAFGMFQLFLCLLWLLLQAKTQKLKRRKEVTPKFCISIWATEPKKQKH